MGKPLIFEKNDFTIKLADPLFRIQCTTLWSYDCRKLVLLRKTAFYNRKKFKFQECAGEVKHRYTKCGRINRLAYVSVAVL